LYLTNFKVSLKPIKGGWWSYNSTRNTSLIRERGLNSVSWKQTALSRACINSRQRSLLRRLYQRIFIQAPVVQGIRHRVCFMFLDGVKSLWAWVRILKLGFDKGCSFLFIVFLHKLCIYCISLTIKTIFKNNNKYKTTITYLTVNGFWTIAQKVIYFVWVINFKCRCSVCRISTTCAFIKWRLRLSDAISQVMYCVWLQNAFVNLCIQLILIVFCLRKYNDRTQYLFYEMHLLTCGHKSNSKR